MDTRTIVIGGGLAGLAAAQALSQHGVGVTVLESRPRLGGRASSFDDATTGAPIDNCQHVSMGCCTNFNHFCDVAGLSPFFRTEAQLNFIADDGRIRRFTAGPWLAPLHLLPALSKLDYLNGRDRRYIGRGLRALARQSPAELEAVPFDRWLAEHRQTENAVNRFWQVVLVSALSESLDRISAAAARKVFVDAFLAHRDGWQVKIPTRTLGDLYGTVLVEHLQSRNVQIRTGAGVKRLLGDVDRITSVELRSGEIVTGDEFVLAVPWHAVRRLLPPQVAEYQVFVKAEQLETAPISSVHLWFDRQITDLPHAVFVDQLSQWMFNRGVLMPDGQTGGTHYYQVVISDSRALAETPSEHVIATVREELAKVWPAANEANLVHSRVVTEHKAVFSVSPGTDALRPGQQSPVSNLQLAGDWTATGWPATMEGAVRSGYLAAENVLSRSGLRGNTGERLTVMQPDLPAARLSRWLFGKRLASTAQVS